MFSDVKNKNIKAPKCTDQSFNNEHFKMKLYIVPIKNIRNLNIRLTESLPIGGLQMIYKGILLFLSFVLLVNIESPDWRYRVEKLLECWRKNSGTVPAVSNYLRSIISKLGLSQSASQQSNKLLKIFIFWLILEMKQELELK